MRKMILLGIAAVAVAMTAGAAVAQTLSAVQDRGALRCGVSTGLSGFSAPDANGVWQGFDVALCRAVAAAVLGDPMAVEFLPLNVQTRFAALARGDVDILARSTTWSFTHDVDLGLSFVGVSYYDGQGLMVRRDLGVAAASELDGARICIQVGSTTEPNLADYFRGNGMRYEPILVETIAEAQQQYLASACDVYTADSSGLAATRASFADPDGHVILPEVIAKEPLGPVVRHGDDRWKDLVRWTFFALVAAEELGVTSANIAELAQGTGTPEINRLLGTEGEMGLMLGLDAEWAVRAISAAGNYGEIFAATIGEGTPIGLADRKSVV